MRENYELIPVTQYERFIRNYRCARCWGQLTGVFSQTQMKYAEIYCGNPECNGNGFVSANYVDRRYQADRSDYREAWINLRKILMLPAPASENLSIDQLNHSLGF